MPTYFSYNALISQRAAGYQNTQYALAELIDNSFDADATKVKLIFFEKRSNNRRFTDDIIVATTALEWQQAFSALATIRLNFE